MFKKKSKTEVILDNRKILFANLTELEALSILALDNSVISTLFSDCIEELKYATPSSRDDVKEEDKRITNLLGDLKIVVNKLNKGRGEEDTQKLLLEIKQRIAIRNKLVVR